MTEVVLDCLIVRSYRVGMRPLEHRVMRSNTTLSKHPRTNPLVVLSELRTRHAFMRIITRSEGRSRALLLSSPLCTWEIGYSALRQTTEPYSPITRVIAFVLMHDFAYGNVASRSWRLRCVVTATAVRSTACRRRYTGDYSLVSLTDRRFQLIQAVARPMIQSVQQW